MHMKQSTNSTYSWQRIFFWSCVIFMSFFLQWGNVEANPPSEKIGYVLTINGAIGPATSAYIVRGIKQAQSKQAQLVIIKMDTPGGLDTAMRQMIKTILASPIPIATYVSPSGARAASAGTYLLYASHIAAMAPGTNLGAATPVSIGGVPKPGDSDDKINPLKAKNKDKAKKAKSKPKPDNAMKKKVLNDAVAYIEGLANLHDRNAEWAKKAVLDAATLTAEKALKQNVIDIIASSDLNLLAQMNGRSVKVLGKAYLLETNNIRLINIEPDWREKLLSVITSPSVAYILMLIGIYGLFFEFANPGFVLPGVVGAICLLLALYAFQLLPINYAGLALIVLGIIFMIAEAFMPSFGALGFGGVIAFVAGSVLLMDTNALGFGIPWTLIGFMAILNIAFFSMILGMAMWARSRKVVTGAENLIGRTAVAVEAFTKEGQVQIGGEFWRAISEHPIQKNEIVCILRVEGVTLFVASENIQQGVE